jgi:PAS domain S-box-containing protein
LEVIPDLKKTNPELFEIYGRVALTGKPERFELYVDGLKSWFSISVYSTEKGTFTAVFDNITARKQAEEALLESEQKFRGIFESSPIAIELYDAQGRLVTLNKASLAIFGAASLKDREGYSLLEDPNMTVEIKDNLRWRSSFRTEVYYDFGLIKKYRVFQTSRSGVVQLDMIVSSVLTGPGALAGYLVQFQDITRRKQLEAESAMYRQRLEEVVTERTVAFAEANEKLTQEVELHKKSEDRLALRALILDNAREVVFLLSQTGDLMYANEAALKTYGYTRDEFLAMNLIQLLPPDLAHLIPPRLKEVVRTGQLELETFHRRKDGTLMPVRLRHSLVQTASGKCIVSVIRDITGEYTLRSLVKQSPAVVWTTDPELKLTFLSGALLTEKELKQEEWSGVGLAEFLKKNGFAGAVESAHRQALGGETADFSLKKGDKSYRGQVSAFQDIDGKLTGTVGVVVEATEHEKVG